MNQNQTARRLIGLAATGTLALGLSLIGPAAYASSTPSVPIVNQTTGSLHITKLASSPSTQPGTGAPASVSNTPIQGVTFTVSPVMLNASAIDLSTDQGWADAAALSALDDTPQPGDFAPGGALAAAGYTLSSLGSLTCTTDQTGVCTNSAFDTLPLGLYYVVETIGGATHPAGAVPGDPFLVTVPMTDPASHNDWVYDIYVYPKNDIVKVFKAVDTSDTITVGDPIVYTIIGDLPLNLTANGDGTSSLATIRGYEIDDLLDPALDVTNATTDPTAIVVTLTDGTPFTLGTTPGDGDYNITIANGNTIQIVWTADGLTKLNQAAAANDATLQQGNIASCESDPVTGISDDCLQVQVVINATVNGHLNTNGANSGTGLITNTATLYPDVAKTGGFSATVTSYFGGIDLHKANSNTGALLSGAQFQIFATSADALAQSNPIKAQKADGTVATDGIFITGSDGIYGDAGSVGILGLNYDTSTTCVTDDGTTVPGTSYWVVETQAPNGYELLTKPVEVCLSGVLDATGGSYDDVYLTNSPALAGFQMPFTGLFGNNLPIYVGLLILAVGGVAIARNRRQQTAK